ncbi:aminopeptidase N [Streptomyces sp. NPDC021100]|uniref:aminopeptidase N n=1 Tax=Streptomyces sp. NPDC021100 TaxID=3365114 RepID=UPI00379F6FE3
MAPMTVLTRDEAQARARLLDVHSYDIDLDLTRGEERFRSTTVIRFHARTPGDTFVEVRPAALLSATLDGRPLDTATLDDNRLPLAALTPGDHELRVEADMRYSRTGEGMHRFTDPVDGETYLYTQLFLDDVQRVFAAFDQPDLKAVFSATVTAPPAWTVLGNTVATRVGPPTEGRWKLPAGRPLSTYFVAFAAGPWHTVRTEHAGLPFALHCRRSLAPHLDADAEELLDLTRRCFDRFHQIFDEPYPFDSYDQAFVPEYNFGAMENPGLVVLRDEYVFRSAATDTERQTRAVTIAHEMAHMWFGDLVTLKWWDDIWLNESFAEYMGYQVLADATHLTGTWTEFGISRKAWGYAADQRETTHPVAPEPGAVHDTATALLNFDGISYAKGASALRQLVAWLGEKDFLAGINAHFTRHRFGNATLADFLDSLAGATERDVHAWAARWLRTTGVDTLTPRITTTDGGWELTVDHEGNRPHRIAVGLYDHTPDDTGRLTARARTEIDLPGPPGPALTGTGPRPALVLLNDGDLGYAKIRLDPASHDTALGALSGLPDPLTRAVVWNSLRDQVRDGLLAPAAYLRATRDHLPHETDNAVVEGVLTFARDQIADVYLPAGHRDDALAALRDTCHDLLRRTERGIAPGPRLAAVRTLIDSAATDAALHDWLRAGSVPGGPALDPELRWRVLTRLAVLGAVTPDAIDTELAADPSATGREGAARCRAALPDPAAKQAAWHALYEDDSLSAYLWTATAQGFWQAEQLDLTRPYRDRYHPDATALAARRGTALAKAAGNHGFPRPHIDHDTLRLGEECLSGTEPTPALRRQLRDRLDDLRRALTVRYAQ